MKDKLKDLFAILAIVATAPLFFFKLGASSLVSFDEAWYAAIARNMLKSGDYLNMTFNGSPYFDHPPAGFWFQAISFKFLGVSEFSARLPSAVFALLTMVFVYLLGKRLINRGVGLISAIALSTAIWFTYRARAADLDIFLTCFFVSSIYLFIKACDNKWFLYPFSISLALLFLTKTGTPVVILPVIGLIFIFRKKNFNLFDLIVPLGLFISLGGYWFYVQDKSQSNFIARYLNIGFPQPDVKSTLLQNFSQIKEYLHVGMGRWFWPGVLGVIGGLVLFPRKLALLSLFCLIFFTPFIFSLKGQIWHLIPLFPIMILAFFGFTYLIIEKVTKKPMAAFLVLYIFGLYLTFTQGRQIWYQFIDIPAYVSDEAILSREAAKYPYPFFIDENYGPAATFYSDKHVEKYSWGSLISFFEGKRPYGDAKNFTLITTQFRLDDSRVHRNMYTIIKVDRDKILLMLPKDLN